MRIFSMTLGILALVSLVACGTKGKPSFNAAKTQERGLPTPHEAGESTYRYAFSGQILNAATKEVLKNFSISLAGQDPAVSAVLNGLGDKNGMFHISRNPSAKDALFSSLPVLISAPGFKPQIQILDLGADCQGLNCAGTKPTPFVLKPLAEVVTALAPALPEAFSTSTIRELTETQGVPALFKQLLSAGKLDPAAGGLLAKSKNKDFLTNMLVLLKPASESQAPELVSSLLRSITTDKVKSLAGLSGMAASLVPLIAASSPEVGSALLAVNTLFPYLTPIMGAVGDKRSGPLGQVLAGMLAGKNADQNLLALAQQLQNGSNPQLAMASFLPLVQGLLAKKAVGSSTTFGGILTSALKDPNLLNLVGTLGKAGAKDPGVTMLAAYLQPLIQGLVGANSPEIASLFNELIKKDGLMGLKDFKSLPGQEKFAKLLPYIDPLINGLNSKDSTGLASLLLPFVEQANPALALRELLTKGAGSVATKAKIAAALFPALQALVGQTVPAKQIFTAQLLQGLLGGNFKDVRVVQDLQGSSAVILAGQARDLFNIANLPNVEKVISLLE